MSLLGPLGSRDPGQRAGLLVLALLLTIPLTACGGVSTEAADPSLPSTESAAPPQFLPVTARWCLEGSGAPRCVELEVAKGERQQSMGLQLRPPLPPLRGMWFPFTPARVVRFWMHRTPEPLDMVFVREGRVIAIEANVAPCARLPCPSYGPSTPSDGVVELGAGQTAALGIVVGTPVKISSIAPSSPPAPAPD